MKLNSIFSDNMILQANKPIFVFGTGQGEVVIEIAGHRSETVSEGDQWTVMLSAVDYGGPYTLKATLNGVENELKNVYFGDVYLFGGQSNNQLKLEQTNTPKELYRNCDSIRLFTVDRLEDEEYYHSKDGWVSAEKDSVGFWPALGYLTADLLVKSKDRKIGVIACYQGASMIQSWIPADLQCETPLCVPLERRSPSAICPKYNWNGDGTLYEYMLKTILPFALKAVIWYQGESNYRGDDSSSEIYGGLLSLLIHTWRRKFNDPSLPFLIIQIHDYMPRINEAGSGWRRIQETQQSVCNTVKNTHLIKSADVSETDDIHPVSKFPLALRIAEVLKTL